MLLQFQGRGMIKNIGSFKIALIAASPSDDNSRVSAKSPPCSFQAKYEMEPSKATKFSAVNAILYRLSTARICSSMITPPIIITKTKNVNR